MSNLYRYARWDDTQRVFDLGDEALMDELSDDLIAHGDIWRALRNLSQRGTRGHEGDGIEGLRQLREFFLTVGKAAVSVHGTAAPR